MVCVEKLQWLKAVGSTRVARAVLACVATGSVAAVPADAQQGSGSAGPKVTVVAANGVRVGTLPTSSLFTTVANGLVTVNHADAPILTPITQYLTVHRGARVMIRTALAALSVHGALGLGPVRTPDRSRSVRATRLDLKGHRWALVLPRSTGRVDRLRISVLYAHGSSGYEAGIRVV